MELILIAAAVVAGGFITWELHDKIAAVGIGFEARIQALEAGAKAAVAKTP